MFIECDLSKYYDLSLEDIYNNKINDEDLKKYGLEKKFWTTNDKPFVFIKYNKEYLNLENINFYLIPKIEISYKFNIFEVKIRESNIFYRFKIIVTNVGVDEVIFKLKEIIDYFNSRYNLLSGIINHLRLRQKNYCIK